MHGKGTWTHPDGTVIEGEWENGKPNGQGTQTLPDGGKYTGEFKDGKYCGQETERDVHDFMRFSSF